MDVSLKLVTGFFDLQIETATTQTRKAGEFTIPGLGKRWEQVRELFLKTGAPDQELARQLGMDHRTVKKFRTAEVYSEAKPRVRESIVDDHASYLDRRLSEGCRSSTRLWRELREMGFCGQVNSVRYWLRQRRSYRTTAASQPHRPALRASPRQVVWLIHGSS